MIRTPELKCSTAMVLALALSLPLVPTTNLITIVIGTNNFLLLMLIKYLNIFVYALWIFFKHLFCLTPKHKLMSIFPRAGSDSSNAPVGREGSG